MRGAVESCCRGPVGNSGIVGPYLGPEGLTLKGFRCVVLAVLVGVPSAATCDSQGRDLIEAAKLGETDRVEALLAGDPRSIEAVDDSGYTALHWAAIRDHLDVAMVLVRAGAPVDAIGADGGSPLHWACHHDRPELVAALLDAGADVAEANRWGRTALHTAARRGCDRVARLLLARGAETGATTGEGWTPLHVAERAGHTGVAAILREAGASDEIRDGEGQRPSDVRFTRPGPIPVSPEALAEVVGEYDLGGATLTVWIEGGVLRVREFAPDTLDPIGPDTFLCRAEPWTVRFTRNAEEAVSGVEVDFLRRTVTGTRIAREVHYVGSENCRACHSGGGNGGAFIAWLSSPHAAAYWRLATDWAHFLASRREEYRDVTSPIDEPRCLACHTIGGHDGDAPRSASLRIEQGVGCESCHGPGSVYRSPEIMRDRARFLANGGRIPGEAVCTACHRDEHFEFAASRPRIQHW